MKIYITFHISRQYNVCLLWYFTNIYKTYMYVPYYINNTFFEYEKGPTTGALGNFSPYNFRSINLVNIEFK